MNISAPFIKRPVATSLLTTAVLLAGLFAYIVLPVASLPEVQFPTIQVQANLPGASAETMASSVATPLERQFSRIAGVTEMTSSSLQGSTNVALQFDLNRNIDAAARDVQAAINAAAGQLPSNLPSAPIYREVNPADQPIMLLSLTSDVLPPSRLFDAADSIIAQKVAQVRGVGQVGVGGGARPAVRIEMNPTVLANYGIGLEEVRTALSGVNSNEAKGGLSNGVVHWTIAANDQLFDAEHYRPIIVAYRHGAPVRLSDIATIDDSVEDVYTAGLENSTPNINISISRRPGANIVETVGRIRALLPSLQAAIPAAIVLHVDSDRTIVIRASVRDIQLTLIITAALVILVIFIFLRNVWATVIPAVALPVSLLGTCGGMYLLGYSLDSLSLMALTIATGFVVDDAIVVIENITRYREAGMSAMQAALRGSQEIGFTVLSMSTSLVAVFLPLLLMGGIVGRLLREFAVTLTIAIFVSLVTSLTVTPMMCSRFLQPPSKERQNRFNAACERGFESFRSAYAHALRWVLAHQPFTIAVTLATVCLSVYLYIVIPKGFFPQQDGGHITGVIQAAQDVSFDVMRQKQAQFTQIVTADPAVDTVDTYAGGVGVPLNIGRMFIHLKPLDERKIAVDGVINRLRGKLATVPGATLFLQATQDIRIGARQSNSQFQYTLESEDLADLNSFAPRMLAKLKSLPQMRDVATDQQDQGPEAELTIDRDTAYRLGIPAATIDNSLYDAFGQRQVSTVYTQLNEYHLVMEVAPPFQRNPDSLKNIYVRSSNGTQVPLSAFTHYETRKTALQVNHQGQFPAVTLSFNLAPGVSLGEAVDSVGQAELETGVPGSIHSSFAGTAQAYQDASTNQLLLIFAALAAVYIVLGMLYESYIHPLTILSTLPSAGVGALLALLLCHTELSVIALIGIILLVGLVEKNAILMVDFALDLGRKGQKNPIEAIYEACVLRFRPIMMTTMAALFGAVPLALIHGEGSEMRRPLGISIVGGLIVSQMLTLFTTPVVYLWFERLSHRFSRRHDLVPSPVAAPVDQNPTTVA